MKWLRGFLFRLGGLFRRERRERELAAEMESHLQMHIEDNLRSGMRNHARPPLNAGRRTLAAGAAPGKLRTSSIPFGVRRQV